MGRVRALARILGIVIAILLPARGAPLHGQEGQASLADRLTLVDASGNFFLVIDQALHPTDPPRAEDSFLAQFCPGEPAGSQLPGAPVTQGELLLGPDGTLWWISGGTRKAVQPASLEGAQGLPSLAEPIDLTGARERVAATVLPTPVRRPSGATPPAAAGSINYIDTHAHFIGTAGGDDCDFGFATQDALAAMDRLGIQKTFVMPPPDSRQGCDSKELAQLAQTNPQRFDFLAGGRSLNPMIQAAARSGRLDADTTCAFDQAAAQIIQDGAVGFGEMAALHLSLASTHPFEQAPPDHPLFLRLADLAARFDVPIDLHMEAVPQDMPFSDAQLTIPVTATNNPSMLAANIAAFERLLSHNPSARIVWDHLGVDETGQRTLELTRRLLQAHPNLYLQIRVIPGGASPNTLLSASGPGDQFPPGRTRPGGPAPPGPISASGIKPEWLELIRSFPDRFILGSDRFYHAPGVGQPFITRITPAQQEMLDRLYRTFLDLLPADLARRVGYENAARLYILN